MNLAVYVFTSDKYLDALPAFAHLFNKYWSPNQQVIVCGFSMPGFDLPDNFTFFSIGKQEDYPIDKWTDALIDVMHYFPKNDVFCLMLEDYWLTRSVDINAVKMLVDYMRQFRGVLKMDMRTDRRHSGFSIADFESNKCGHIPLVLSDPTSPYHMSLLCGLWNRDAMLQVMHRGETPWEVETTGQTYKNLVSLSKSIAVVGTNVPDGEDSTWCPIPHTLAHRRGDPSKYAFNEDPAYGMIQSDIDELLSLGFIDGKKI